MNFTLEPQTPQEWHEFSILAHKMVDDMLEHLSTLPQQPAWQKPPQRVRAALHEPLPHDGIGAEAAYNDFVTNVLPYPNGNLHPRFWGWVQGTGTPLGMMADMLASGMNAHLAGFNQAPALVEHQLIAWLAELLGMPKGTSGVMASGGTVSSIIGLAVARFAKAGWNVREEGLQGHTPLTMYCSTETHSWAQRGVELLGLGNKALRRIPVDEAYKVRIDALCEAIQQDRTNGFKPICVIGSAGTVNTGATDDLTALADLCAEEDLWFHVDGAFGAIAAISDKLRPIVAGMERADSIGFDLHKWLYLPFECACVLVRDVELHRQTFTMQPSYIAPMERGVIAGGLPFAERGLELTRSFKALKAWMSLKAHGVKTFARAVEENVAQAQYLASLVNAHADMELCADVPMNIVCFRYHPSKAASTLTLEQLNALNQELLLRLQESGRAVVSSTVLRGVYTLRAAIVNQRSTMADFDELVRAVAEIGKPIFHKHCSH
jgi:glutamate/tyrosine decarboxylase-like PLP-dependent enzyme